MNYTVNRNTAGMSNTDGFHVEMVSHRGCCVLLHVVWPIDWGFVSCSSAVLSQYGKKAFDNRIDAFG